MREQFASLLPPKPTADRLAKADPGNAARSACMSANVLEMKIGLARRIDYA